MTQVRTRCRPKSYAKTEDTTPILLLDGLGQINVILIDNPTIILNSLKISENKQLLVGDLINASLVYGLASQLNLEPGVFSESDDLIIDYLSKHISPNIIEEDKTRVIDELKASWARLHAHPLAKGYIALSEPHDLDRFRIMAPFAVFSGFEIFIRDYLYSASRRSIEMQGTLSPSFCLLIDMVYRSLRGLNFIKNHFLQEENIIAVLGASCEVEPYEPLVVHRRQREKNLKEIKETPLEKVHPDDLEVTNWLDTLIGFVGIELEDLERDFPLEAGFALAQLIETGSFHSDTEELNQQLSDLKKYLSKDSDSLANLMSSVKFDSSKWPKDKALALFRDAICYAMNHYAKIKGILLKLPREVPFYFWAGKGIVFEQQSVIPGLSEKVKTLKNYELRALYKNSQHVLVQEVVNEERKCRDELSGLVNALAGFSVAAAVMGPILFRGHAGFGFRPPVPLRPIERAPVVVEQKPQTVPEEENILNLAAPSSCCIL